MNVSRSAPVRVEPVSDKRSLKTFIRVPWSVYSGDPCWVPPLIMERKQSLSPRNPFFRHARWQAWVAFQDDRPVGRISAQIDELHLERYQDATGFFGCLEAVDDPAVFTALFEAAETWLRDQGMTRARGPFSLSINQEVGLLVDNFDTPPFLMMGHAPPYYGPAIERLGYAGVKDLLAYQMTPQFEAPKVMEALCARIGKKVRMRSLRRKDKHAELELMRDIFNDAWSENWSFTPFTEEEFRHIGQELLPLIPDDFIQIAELDGEPVAFIVLMPNVNEAIADLNGRLLAVRLGTTVVATQGAVSENRPGVTDGRAASPSPYPAGSGPCLYDDPGTAPGHAETGHGRRGAVLDPGGQPRHARHYREPGRARHQTLSGL